MEEDICKDASDTRADKAKERQDHNIGQHIQQEDKREQDVRKEAIAEPDLAWVVIQMIARDRKHALKNLLMM